MRSAIRRAASQLKGRAVALRATKGRNSINVLDTFPTYAAHGWGTYRNRAALTIENINMLAPALTRLLANDCSRDSTITGASLQAAEHHRMSRELAERFAFYGSDKSTAHNYHLLYSSLLSNADVRSIFEIGLGTNNPKIVSTMGKNGRPGASLRAFRDVFKDAEVFGADIDSGVLFQEERIKTFWVDQMNADTLAGIELPKNLLFDLMIDDGLHAPVANLNSLGFFLPRLRVGGWAVVEDVNPLTSDIWRLVTALIEPRYSGSLIATQSASVFVAQRLS